MNPLPPDSKLVYEGKLLKVYRRPVELYDGTKTEFDLCTRPDTSSVLAFIDREHVLLTEQTQPHRPTPFFALPGGRVEDAEDPQQTALRECLEETGYACNHATLWHEHSYISLVQFNEYLYLAFGAQQTYAPTPDSGERITTRIVHWNELVELALNNELRSHMHALEILRMHYHEPSRLRLKELQEKI